MDKGLKKIGRKGPEVDVRLHRSLVLSSKIILLGKDPRTFWKGVFSSFVFFFFVPFTCLYLIEVCCKE